MAEPASRCGWNAALVYAIAPGAIARGALTGGRLTLSVIAAAFLVMSIQGCVTETKRRSALDSSARAVSVELRRTIAGIGYSGVLFTPLDAKGAELLGWTPSEYDIARMEAHLPNLLSDAGPKLFADEPPDLGEYRRQYSGHVTGDRRIIQANYIHFSLIAERNLDWKHRRVPILDAGARYFRVWFDMQAVQILHLLPES